MSAHLSLDLPPPRMTRTVPPNTPDMQTLAYTFVPEIASAEVSSPNQVIGADSPGVGQTSESPARDYRPLVWCLVLCLRAAKRCVGRLLESNRDRLHHQGRGSPFPWKVKTAPPMQKQPFALTDAATKPPHFEALETVLTQGCADRPFSVEVLF